MVPVTPFRAHDSRVTGGPISGPIEPDETVRIAVRGVGEVPTSASAVYVNLHVLDPEEDGSIVAWDGDVAEPSGATLFFERTQSTNGTSLAGLSDGGELSVRSTQRTHFVVDICGYEG